MNTVQAEKLFSETLSKHGKPGVEVVDSGQAHDVRRFVGEISGGTTDQELERWIKDQAIEAALFERKVVEDLMAAFPEAGIERKAVRLVLRTPPHIVRTRNDHGETCWRVSARVGTRIEPYPRADPRSSRSIAIANAKLEEQQAAEREKKLSEILEGMP